MPSVCPLGFATLHSRREARIPTAVFFLVPSRQRYQQLRNLFSKESQKAKQAQETRKEAAEKRKQDLHPMKLSLAEAKADHQLVLNSDARYQQYKQKAA